MDIDGLTQLVCLRCGEGGVVAAMQAGNASKLRRLMEMGLALGIRIDLIQKDSRNVLIFAGQHELALDRDMASCVFVRVAASVRMETVR